MRALISYWDGHKMDFGDPKKRNTAYEGAVQRIWEECAVAMTKKQIQNKFEKMWNRQRAQGYIANGNGYSEMFLIGSQCLDLEKLGLIPQLLTESCIIPGVNEMMQELDLCNDAEVRALS